MSDEEALLAAIVANPDEMTPRLVYADWLDEGGDEIGKIRAEFIRLTHRMNRTKRGHDTRRARQMLRTYGHRLMPAGQDEFAEALKMHNTDSDLGYPFWDTGWLSHAAIGPIRDPHPEYRGREVPGQIKISIMAADRKNIAELAQAHRLVTTLTLIVGNEGLAESFVAARAFCNARRLVVRFSSPIYDNNADLSPCVEPLSLLTWVRTVEILPTFRRMLIAAGAREDMLVGRRSLNLY